MGDVETILRTMLRELFEADSRGARRDRLARAHGYADGYMKALVDLGHADERRLLGIVLEERRRSADLSHVGRSAA
jgi:hypothetical protein